MPAIFVGHGNPMNIGRHNRWTEGWKLIGTTIPPPKAILAVSAHWYVPATMVTAMAHPRTIHDFGGFPEELYHVQYPAPGDPELARQLRKMLAPLPVGLDEKWGLDHGTWSVLHHMFPKADIPVVQLSIDRTQSSPFHYEIGRRLAPLRDEDVLILGSGNLVHNLQTYDWGNPDRKVFAWALRFEKKVSRLLMAGDDGELVDYPQIGPEANLSIPTPDHYLPLLYVLGSRRKEDEIIVPVDGFDGGSVSMLAVQLS
jgi:4,5-DOPA dioxygenase extradiol